MGKVYFNNNLTIKCEDIKCSIPLRSTGTTINHMGLQFPIKYEIKAVIPANKIVTTIGQLRISFSKMPRQPSLFLLLSTAPSIIADVCSSSLSEVWSRSFFTLFVISSCARAFHSDSSAMELAKIPAFKFSSSPCVFSISYASPFLSRTFMSCSRAYSEDHVFPYFSTYRIRALITDDILLVERFPLFRIPSEFEKRRFLNNLPQSSGILHGLYCM